MSGIATAIAGTAVVGYLANNNASNKAASAQQNATNAADATQMSMFNTEQANAAPWLKSGAAALGNANSLMANPSSYLQSPSYQFNLNNGMDAINRQTSNRGGMMAGSTLGAVDQFGQGLASQGYQQSLSNYMQMAGMGQTAVGQTNQAGMNASNIVSGNLMNLGAGQSAAAIAQGNNLTGTMNNGMNQYLNYSLMNGMMGQNGGINGSVGQGLGSGSWGSDMSGQMGGSSYVPYPTIG